jgi:hypothetical protein
MKRFSFALAIGAFALLPLGLSQPASAHDYYDGYRGDSRLERDIGRDRAKLDHDYAEHRYYSEREQQALRDGHYLSAWWYGMRRHHEEREINARRADLHGDHERLDRYAY